MTVNRYGLKRYIPADIALKIRQQSRFGCVICRCAIYHYEHIIPEFSDAKEHNPDLICLLCGGCHDRVTRGRLSKETIQKEYLNIQRQFNVARPFEELDLATRNIEVIMGTASFKQASSLIRINGNNLLSITPPEEGAIFPTLSGIFCDAQGNEIFRIDKNVWKGPLDAWDVAVVGRVVTIKLLPHKIALSFEVIPPNVIRVSYLNMYKDGCHIICDNEKLLIGQTFEEERTYVGLSNFNCLGANPGISVDSREVKRPKLNGVSINGGKGISLEGTGIKVAVNSCSMWIKEMKVWNE